MLPDATVQLSHITIYRGEQETIVHQFCQQIREMILSGDLANGTRFPSTRDLAKELRISRTTVRECYEQLVAESYLSSSTGKGTFVIDHLVLRTAARESSANKLALGKPEKNSCRSSPQLSRRSKQYLNFPNCYTSPESVPFNPALPDFSLFPYSKWTRILKKTLSNPESTAMNYGDAAGYPPLKQAIAENLRLTRGLSCDPEQVTT